MSSETEKLWTIEDVSDYCRVKTTVIKYWLHNTDLPYLKIGKHVRFDPRDVKDWVEGNKVKLRFDRLKNISLRKS